MISLSSSYCESADSSESKSESGKKLNLKKSGRTYNTNWVAVRERSSYVEGLVNGTKCQIVPDTGAEITISARMLGIRASAER